MHIHHEDEIIPALLRKFDDQEFIQQFEMTASIEHGASIKMLHFINDLERRKTFLELGYSSVFDFCVRRIKYSSSQAGRRIQAARCCRRYPEAWTYLREREVCMMTLAMVEAIITDDNKDDVFRRIRRASRREVERLLSEYRPPATLRDRIRYVQVAQPQARNVHAALLDRSVQRGLPEEWRDSIPVQEKVFVQFLADDEFLKVFEEVQGLVANGNGMTFAELITIVLIEYRDRHSHAAKHERRVARSTSTARHESVVTKNGSTRPDSHRWECENAQYESSRHVPDNVRDDVFVRDAGQCTFVGWNGVRCSCKKGLQLDHIKPFAAGGTHDLSNLRLLCGAHNRLAAERTLGKHVMQPFWRKQ